ncbi:MAG: efflux RND transporter periplasmic adaptor subunit [Thermosynechococcaceae cyanobacterium]
MATPTFILAHAGHGDEFKGGNNATPSVGAVQVDAETAQRLDLKVEPAKRQQLAVGIKATGQIETLPNQRVEVTTPVKGTVTRLLAKPGDAVQAGQAVAILSSPELAELRISSQVNRAEAIANIQQAQADVKLARQNYDRQQQIAKAELKQARTQLAFAQEKYSRDQELATAGALPRRQALESKTELADAQTVTARAASRLDFLEADAQLQRAYSALQVAKSRLKLSDGTYQARLKQLGTQPNADGTLTITAPISGIVSDQDTTLGESGEDAGKPILTILNNRRVLVTANIYEKDIAQVKTGQSVEARVSSLPNRTFQGRVSLIEPVVAGENRVVPVKAELGNVNGDLKPGMFANLEVFTDRTANALLAIPQSAVVETNDKKTLVFIQNGSAFQPVNVTLGQTAGNWVEVKKGLFAGDLVVTQRAPQLYAQSLRGDVAKAPNEQEAAPVATANDSTPMVPLWWAGVGVAIASTTFWAGTAWSKHRMQRQIELATHNGHAPVDSTESIKPISEPVEQPDPQPSEAQH